MNPMGVSRAAPVTTGSLPLSPLVVSESVLSSKLLFKVIVGGCFTCHGAAIGAGAGGLGCVSFLIGRHDSKLDFGKDFWKKYENLWRNKVNLLSKE